MARERYEDLEFMTDVRGEQTMARERYEDLEFMTDVRAAVLSGPRLSANILLLSIIAFFLGAGLWASVAELDEVTSGNGRVIPSSELQVIQNLEGGILAATHIRQGDVVGKDQVLLTIDDTLASSKYREDRSRVLGLQVAIARLQAEAAGETPSFPDDLAAERPDLVGSELALYQARKSEFEAALQTLRSQVAQRQQELVEARSRIDQLRGSEALAREELEMLRPVVEQGAGSRIEMIRLERQINDIAGDLAATESSIPRIRASLNEAQRRISERRAAYESQVAKDMVEAQGQLAAISEVVASAQDRVRRTEIRSPVDGTVQQILIKTIGGVIQPGQDLVHIVPLEDNLLVEAQIRPADIAFLSSGQDAVVKITAYDFAIYGGLNATLEQISADTITDEKGERFYQIRVRTRRNFLVARNGDTLPIIPGMVAEVDILTGKKTVLAYLLKPILRARYKALRER
jgi:adhesin transport system membrane fusion protein